MRIPMFLVGCALLIAPLVASADEVTVTQPIVELRYNGSADYAFFIGPAGWAAPSCPTAYYAQIPASQAGRDKLLALVMAAYLAGKRVAFQGLCGSVAGYFNVSYVIVMD